MSTPLDALVGQLADLVADRVAAKLGTQDRDELVPLATCGIPERTARRFAREGRLRRVRLGARTTCRGPRCSPCSTQRRRRSVRRPATGGAASRCNGAPPTEARVCAQRGQASMQQSKEASRPWTGPRKVRQAVHQRHGEHSRPVVVIAPLLLGAAPKSGPRWRAGSRGDGASGRSCRCAQGASRGRQEACREWELDGRAVVRDHELFVPNYLMAQETPQSDRARARTSRERRAQGKGKNSDINAHGHAPSHPVTQGHSDPSPTEPTLPEPAA